VRGETVTQSAYRDRLLQTSGFTGLATSFYRGVITDRLFRMLAGEESGLRSFALPIATQDSQQGRREHYVAIFPTFALTHADDHAAGELFVGELVNPSLPEGPQAGPGTVHIRPFGPIGRSARAAEAALAQARYVYVALH
jgi:hypothetical protein